MHVNACTHVHTHVHMHTRTHAHGHRDPLLGRDQTRQPECSSSTRGGGFSGLSPPPPPWSAKQGGGPWPGQRASRGHHRPPGPRPEQLKLRPQACDPSPSLPAWFAIHPGSCSALSGRSGPAPEPRTHLSPPRGRGRGPAPLQAVRSPTSPHLVCCFPGLWLQHWGEGGFQWREVGGHCSGRGSRLVLW